MPDFQYAFRTRFGYQAAAARREDASLKEAEGTVAFWACAFGKPSRDLDFEDWHEEAAKFVAACDTGLPVFAMGMREGRQRAVASFNTNLAQPESGVPLLLTGTLLRREPLEEAGFKVAWPDSRRAAASSAYFRNPAFAAHAGRLLELVAVREDSSEGSGLIEAIQRMVADCGPDVAVKVVSVDKHAPVAFGSFPDPSVAAIRSWLYETFEYDLVHVQGRLPEFLVQERLPLSSEYRVVVVDGEPVAGAGCIEWMCPPYNRGERFHPAVEGIRGGNEVRQDPELVGRYVEAARAAAADMRAHDPLAGDGTYDFAVGPGDNVVLVEVNPLGNFGLYAMDAGAVATAVLEACRRRRDSAVEPCPPGPGM